MSDDYFTPDFNTCVGPSMYPTLKSGDSYILNKYNSPDDIKIGDVIVFKNPDEAISIVHRVVKKSYSGVITRGDNNNLYDDYVVKFEDIFGWIKFVKRENKQIQILNGFWGFIWHKLMLFRKYSRPFIVRPVIFIVDLITQSGVFFFLQKMLTLNIVEVKRNDKIQQILTHKKKVIGKRFENEQWQIKFPYRMFINKDKI